MNIYGDAVTPDMREPHGKIVGLALNGTGTARADSEVYKYKSDQFCPVSLWHYVSP